MKNAPADQRAPQAQVKMVGVVAVGEGAEQDLVATLQRIPLELRSRVVTVVALAANNVVVAGLPPIAPLTPMARGYGATLKAAYDSCLAAGADIVVTLHTAGEYPPEILGELLKPIDDGRADAVFGSRNVELLSAVDGGMPVYKFLGNRMLSTLENLLVRTSLTDLHSGYRALSANALRAIPFSRNTDDWHFDTQVILQLHAAQLRIAEVPMGTYSSTEIGVFSGVRYAAEVARSVADYKLHEIGLKASPAWEVRAQYAPKRSVHSSHARLLELLGPGSLRVLDVGSGYGELAAAIQVRGHVVTAMDMYEPRVPVAEFIRADFSQHIPLASDRVFDVVVFADVLEHMPDPQHTLQQALRHLAPGGVLLVSLPNAVHWSVRAQMAVGRFEYTNRGILDRGHLRFFTEQSARRLFRDCGLEVVRHVTTPVPWENVSRRHGRTPLVKAVELVDAGLGLVRPNLFAYQHVFRLRRPG